MAETDNAGRALQPWTNVLRLDRSTMLATHRYADRFSVSGSVQLAERPEPISKSTCVPSLLVSVFISRCSGRGTDSRSTVRTFQGGDSGVPHEHHRS